MSSAVPMLLDLAEEISGVKSGARLFNKYGKSKLPSRLRGKHPLTKGHSYRPRKKARTTNTRKTIGQPVGLSNAKRHASLVSASAGKNTRTLYDNELTEIPEANSAFDIQGRRRDIVNLRGFKCCATIHNLSDTPLMFNWAIVAPRGNASAITTQDFFRGTNAERALDADNNLSTLQWHCSAINTDRFTVLKHKKMMIAPNANPEGSNFTFNVANNVKVIDDWTKLDRQLRYAEGKCLDAVFVVYWADFYGQPSGAVPATGAYAVQDFYTTFYHDPINC